MNKTKPLHVMLAPKARARLEVLQELSEAESKSEVVRRALACYEVLLRAQSLGGRVIIETETTTQEVLLV